VEDPDAKGFVRLEVLLPALKEILLKDKWRPAPKEQLLQAFEFFDFKHTGRLSPTYMRRLLTGHAYGFHSRSNAEKPKEVAINDKENRLAMTYGNGFCCN
ncbi:hypothetical protein AVEN_258901-1, partial [Araneus ventricosus]